MTCSDKCFKCLDEYIRGVNLLFMGFTIYSKADRYPLE